MCILKLKDNKTKCAVSIIMIC